MLAEHLLGGICLSNLLLSECIVVSIQRKVNIYDYNVQPRAYDAGEHGRQSKGIG